MGWVIFMRIEVDIPENTYSAYSISKLTPQEGFPVWKAYAQQRGLEGTYTVLSYLTNKNYSVLIMNDGPSEFEEHIWLFNRLKGHILIGGLGISMIHKPLLESDEVESVTIIEKSQEVINLVWPHCLKDDRFSIVHADINDFIPSEDDYWDVVWLDTWMNTDGESLPEYKERMTDKFAGHYGQINGWKW